MTILNHAKKAIMPEYKILLSKTAVKTLDRLPNQVAENILRAIQNLITDPKPHGVKKLKGREGYRIRKGDYRIIYDVHDDTLVIQIIAIGHRKEIYD
jgi:mRNA interferase RelE/StbE